MIQGSPLVILFFLNYAFYLLLVNLASNKAFYDNGDDKDWYYRPSDVLDWIILIIMRNESDGNEIFTAVIFHDLSQSVFVSVFHLSFPTSVLPKILSIEIHWWCKLMSACSKCKYNHHHSNKCLFGLKIFQFKVLKFSSDWQSNVLAFIGIKFKSDQAQNTLKL